MKLYYPYRIAFFLFLVVVLFIQGTTFYSDTFSFWGVKLNVVLVLSYILYYYASILEMVLYMCLLGVVADHISDRTIFYSLIFPFSVLFLNILPSFFGSIIFPIYMILGIFFLFAKVLLESIGSFLINHFQFFTLYWLNVGFLELFLNILVLFLSYPLFKLINRMVGDEEN